MNDQQSEPSLPGISASAAAIFVLLVIAAGVFVGSNINLTPPIASLQAAMVDNLYNTLLGVAAAIFLLVEGALIYAVLRFRRRPDHQGEGVPSHGDSQMELAWTIVPALIVLWLAIHSARILTQLNETADEALTVQVIARQFTWEFEYPEFGVRSSELHVPKDRPIALELRSLDVIHSFWVPAFRIKQDAFPERTTRTTFTPVMVGEFPIVCAELCGVGHSIMRSQVIVEEPADFESWLQESSE